MNSSEPPPDPSAAEAPTEPRPPSAPAEPGYDWPTLPVCQTPLPSFPLDALPIPLREDARDRAALLQVSTDAVVLPMLTAIGTAAAKQVSIRVGRVTSPIHLWALAPMESGEGKSPLIESLTGPLREAQMHLREQMTTQGHRRRVDLRLFRKERTRLDRELLALLAQPTDDREDEVERLRNRLIDIEQQLDELEEVGLPYLLCEDITSQALILRLAHNPHPLMLASAEGSVFLRSVGGTSTLGQPIESVLKAYSREDIYVDRVSRPSIHVSKPVLGMLLATQPVVIRYLLRARAAAGRGLWERFLYAVPPSTVGRRKPVGLLDYTGVGYYDALITRLLRCPLPGTPPQELDFEPQAAGLFDDYCLAVDRRMADGDLSADPMRGWAGKMRSNLLRLSAALHLASESGEREDEVRAETVRNAIELLDVASHHARYVLEQMPHEEDDETCVIRQLQQHGGPITKRDIHRRLQVRFRKVDLLQDALERLTAKGLLRMREEHHPRGQPTHWVHLHPDLHRRDDRTP